MAPPPTRRRARSIFDSAAVHASTALQVDAGGNVGLGIWPPRSRLDLGSGGVGTSLRIGSSLDLGGILAGRRVMVFNPREAMRTFVAEHFSPWSEKARWALDHHHLSYAYREHVPLVGEPLLRLRARRLAGRVSTPLLITPHGVLTDSFAIAEHADRIGGGATLFPAGADVAAWNARSEAALTAGRVLYLDRFALDHEAKVEMLPPFLPVAARRAAVPMADLAISFLRRKYGIDEAARTRAEASLVHELSGLREALGGRAWVLREGFSYADVAMSVTLQFIAPVDGRYIPLGPATRASWSHAALADRFADLVAWRDQLYERHRRVV